MSGTAPARPWYEFVTGEIAIRGWTKSQLSERSGVSRTAIDKWQTNPRPPQAASVNAVADALGVPRERALRLAGVITAAPGAQAGVPPDVLDLIRRRYPDPEQQRKALEALEAIGSPEGGESAGGPRRTA